MCQLVSTAFYRSREFVGSGFAKLRNTYPAGLLNGRIVVITGGIIACAIVVIRLAQIAYRNRYNRPSESMDREESASTDLRPYHAPNNGFKDWTKLPIEMIQMIFTFVDDTKLRIEARRTCKRWYKALNKSCTQLPPLIDLRTIPEIVALPSYADRKCVYRSLATVVEVLGGWDVFHNIKVWNQDADDWPMISDEIEEEFVAVIGYREAYQFSRLWNPPRIVPYTMPIRQRVRQRKTVRRKVRLSEMEEQGVIRGMTLQGGLFVLSKCLNKSTLFPGSGYIEIKTNGRITLFADGNARYSLVQTFLRLDAQLKPLLKSD